LVKGKQRELFPKPRRGSWKVMLPVWAAFLLLLGLGLYFELDEKLLAGGLVLYGLLTSAFAWFIGVVGLVPLIGPLVVKILTIPTIWLLNALGYFVSAIAIKRGYGKDVLTYRALTVMLIIGIIIGYILGKLI
jgi:hypothetical protein